MIVRTLKTVMILVLVTLWVMASNHCRLEHIPALAFMTCCDHDDSAGSQDKDCEADGCAAVENQLYKADTSQRVTPAPTVLLTHFLSPVLAELLAPAASSHVLPDAAPMELPRVWQFSYRTALPPRAPSLAS